MICEKCEKEHDGSFGSGRFCSRGCANSRVQTIKMNESRRQKLQKPERFNYCECGAKLSHNNKTGICKDCRSPAKTKTENTRNYRRRRKEKFVEYKGGKCVKCGYNKSNRALEFHHLNPEEKDFNLSKPENVSWERTKAELDKCILVCSNCHSEIHEEIDFGL